MNEQVQRFKKLAEFANKDLLARRTMRDWADQNKMSLARLNKKYGNIFQLEPENPYQVGMAECQMDLDSPEEIIRRVGTKDKPSEWATPGREPLRLWSAD